MLPSKISAGFFRAAVKQRPLRKRIFPSRFREASRLDLLRMKWNAKPHIWRHLLASLNLLETRGGRGCSQFIEHLSRTPKKMHTPGPIKAANRRSVPALQPVLRTGSEGPLQWISSACSRCPPFVSRASHHDEAGTRGGARMQGKRTLGKGIRPGVSRASGEPRQRLGPVYRSVDHA
jgi:hypothetical protein